MLIGVHTIGPKTPFCHKYVPLIHWLHMALLLQHHLCFSSESNLGKNCHVH